MAELTSRVVIAGTHSGVGKTTLSIAIMAAFVKKGLKVTPAKVGPDFIDPSYHELAAGKRSVNLDVFIQGKEAILPLAAAAAEGSDLLVTEGVMGLFDDSGFAPSSGSTAEVAKLLDAPVVLIVDCSAMSSSVKAVAHGFSTLDKDLKFAGVILNKVASEGHEILLKEALEEIGVKVLGTVMKNSDFELRERHLGLIPAVEHKENVLAGIDRLAHAAAECLDLDALWQAAAAAPVLRVQPLVGPSFVKKTKIGICAGKAFSFYYPENLASLEAAGGELFYFDPLVDEKIPDVQGIYMGGGFPEVYAEEISANKKFLENLFRKASAGVSVWAECGGYLLLCQAIGEHRMAGVIREAKAFMTDRPTLGYRQGHTLAASVLGPEGTRLKGHEYHYSQVGPPGEDLFLEGRFQSGRQGYIKNNVFAGYLHQHLAASPEIAEAFIRSVPEENGNSASQ